MSRQRFSSVLDTDIEEMITTEAIISFMSKMPVREDHDIDCVHGENPHSNLDPAFITFEEARLNWNVLGFARISAITALTRWTKQEAVLWSLGLSLPRRKRHELTTRVCHDAAKGPCIFDSEGKQRFSIWIDRFLQNAPLELTPSEWVAYTKEHGGNEFALPALDNSLQLRKLWDQEQEEDWWNIGSDRKMEEESSKSESLEADQSFVDVDWNYYGEMLYATPIKVVAASLGINPDHHCANTDWAQKFRKYATGDVAIKLKQLVDRYLILIKHKSTRGGKVKVERLYGTGPEVIEIKGFADLAKKLGWHLPEQFPGQIDTTFRHSMHHFENTQGSTPGEGGKLAASAKTDCETQSSLTAIPGKLPPNWIGKEAIKIAFMIEKTTGIKAGAKAVMENLRSQATHGGDQGRLKIEDQKLGVSWLTEDTKWVDWTTHACREALRKWNSSRNK